MSLVVCRGSQRDYYVSSCLYVGHKETIMSLVVCRGGGVTKRHYYVSSCL